MNVCKTVRLFSAVFWCLFSVQADKTDSSGVFELGRLTVTGKRIPKIKLNAGVNSSSIKEREAYNVADALNLLPGISISTVGARFESGVMIRGFDLRQVPLYIDGIPVYVPYDGYVDLGRFTTADAAEIQVDKGYSSVLSGPNTLGGAINVVSRKPIAVFEMNGSAGVMGYKPVPSELSDMPAVNGNRFTLYLGSRLSDQWYFMTDGNGILQDAFNLSRHYHPSAQQISETRNQSYRRDVKASFKIGYTPSKNAEYTLSYSLQHGEKGGPPYVGEDTSIRPRYWRWPYWNKQSVYLYSRTPVGSSGYVKIPLYFDQFRNSLYSYDDTTYTTFKRPYAFKSRYDDYTLGGGVETGFQPVPWQSMRLAVTLKRDLHSECDAADTAQSPSKSVFVTEPRRYFIDNTVHAAIDDNLEFFGGAVVLNTGAALARRAGERADNYFKYHTVTDSTHGTEIVVPDSIAPFPERIATAWNLQAKLLFVPREHHQLSIAAARKTRFPTIKDRFSYRLGTAYPNSGLEPEIAVHYELGYTADLDIAGVELSIQGDFFYAFIDNVIQSVTVEAIAPDSGTKTQMRNTGEARVSGNGNLPGVELALRCTPLRNCFLCRRLDIDGAYSFAEKRNESEPSLVFTDLPVCKALLSLRWEPVKYAWLLGTFEWNSKRWVDTKKYRSLPEYHVFMVKGSVAIGANATFEAGINNMCDVNYSLQDGYPETGRNFFSNLRFGFRNR